MIFDPVSDAIQRFLESVPDEVFFKVGYSGGMDSHVLLHALRHSGGAGRMSAIHVNHGLHPEAGAWAAHCRRICDQMGVPAEIIDVSVATDGGEGPEAAARRARYAAFQGKLGSDDALVLAHHQHDQAETFLLQLLRGAGPAGLSAMPARAALGQGRLMRPFLELPRAAIRAYAARKGLQFIEDPSNDDLGVDRNYLRREILPRLEQRWPAAARTIARAASHQAAVASVARDLGAQAIEAAQGGVTLSCQALARLEPDSARLALRAWLASRGFPPPSKALLDRILDEVVPASTDAEPLVAWPGAEVRRYRNALHVMSPLFRPSPGDTYRWHPERPLDLPHGRLTAIRVRGRGLKAALSRAPLEVRFRQGGERCRPAGQARSSTLKAWFQRRGVPPWERDRIPLLYQGGELAAVAGYWVCEGYQCANAEEGLLIEWSPAAR